jgi:hypothetical protein
MTAQGGTAARREWTHADRPFFAEGPWNDEPDKVHWIDPATDLDCLIVRNPVGALCGYVGVPPGHPWHSAHYNDVDVSVHGGLTFADSCDEDAPEGHGICHVPLPGRPEDLWWLGFDCAHGGMDVIPRMLAYEKELNLPSRARYRGPAETYRDVAYVTEQCERLAAQIAAVTA